MRKIILIIFVLVIAAGLYAAWNVLGPTVSAPEEKYLFIKTGSNYDDVKKQLLDHKIISGTFFFDRIAKQVKYDQNVKAGRYEIKDGGSLINLVRMLKSGSQSQVRLVINKLRTKEDLAEKIGENFECDSTQVIQFLTSNDSLIQIQ